MEFGAALAIIIAVAGAFVSVATRNIVHAVFGLGLCLAGVALAFLVLGSPFVAAMEVLIYIGGITVAMVFAVMLSTVGRSEPKEGQLRRTLAAAGALAVFGVGAGIIMGLDLPEPLASRPEDAWSVQQIGRDLLDRYNLAFEALSVVLLVAIIGAITIASRDDEHLDPTVDEPATNAGGDSQ